VKHKNPAIQIMQCYLHR